jgi:hypothetical protein
MDGMTAHRQALQIKHTLLEKELAAEMKHRMPDSAKVSELKRQKLRIKQELEGMMEAG